MATSCNIPGRRYWFSENRAISAGDASSSNTGRWDGVCRACRKSLWRNVVSNSGVPSTSSNRDRNAESSFSRPRTVAGSITKLRDGLFCTKGRPSRSNRRPRGACTGSSRRRLASDSLRNTSPWTICSHPTRASNPRKHSTSNRIIPHVRSLRWIWSFCPLAPINLGSPVAHVRARRADREEDRSQKHRVQRPGNAHPEQEQGQVRKTVPARKVPNHVMHEHGEAEDADPKGVPHVDLLLVHLSHAEPHDGHGQSEGSCRSRGIGVEDRPAQKTHPDAGKRSRTEGEKDEDNQEEGRLDAEDGDCRNDRCLGQ